MRVEWTEVTITDLDRLHDYILGRLHDYIAADSRHYARQLAAAHRRRR